MAPQRLGIYLIIPPDSESSGEFRSHCADDAHGVGLNPTVLERDRLKRVSEALRAASKVFDTTGEVFFRSLTEHLSAVLQVDYVSIGELSDGGRRIRTVAVSAGGKNLENLEYDLDHTPCQQVLERGRFFDHGEVQSHFPQDEFLVQMGFKNYLGVALVDSTGLRLGVMSVMSRHPFTDPKTAELTLGLFAARTSLEMERRRSELALRASEARNRAILKAMPDVMFVLDRTGRVVDYTANEGNALYAPPEQVIGQNIRDRLSTAAAESVMRVVERTSNSAETSCVAFVVQTAKRARSYESLCVPFDAGNVLMIVRDVTDAKIAEEELRKLPARLLSAQDQERRRIARELHDTTAQSIAAISMNLVQLEREGLPPSATRLLADCKTLCETSLREIRTLSYLLHPPMLDEVGLLSAVRWFVDGLQTRSGLRVELKAPPSMERLPAALERDLFFVVQEALLNVIRHAGSDTAEVRVERQAAQLILQIRDDGGGMPLALPEQHGNWAFVGVGIPSMRERLRQNGGDLQIKSNPQGTTIIATVPLLVQKRTDPPLRDAVAYG
jgi:PAS domain S-box-containing protein